MRRDERPLRRVNPSGEVRWIARATGRDGSRRSFGTYAIKGPCRKPSADSECCAQHRIWQAYEEATVAPQGRGTVAEYARTWLRLHPRSERSNETHEGRLRAVLPLDLGDGPLGEMLFADVDRSHAVRLREVLLVDQGRAATGAKAIIATIGALWQDALDDGATRTQSPFLRLKIKATDPRVRKPARKPRVLSWEQMHALCAAAGPQEPMLRLLSDCGLRLGETFPIHREDVKLSAGACDEAPVCAVKGPHVHVRRKAWKAREFEGAKGSGDVVRERVAPLPPALAALLAAMPSPIRPDGLMFPAPSGGIWWEPDFRRGVWNLAAARAGLEGVTPHHFRHSWVTLLRAAGVSPVELAEAAGHSLDTAQRVYTHALGGEHDAMRRAVGE